MKIYSVCLAWVRVFFLINVCYLAEKKTKIDMKEAIIVYIFPHVSIYMFNCRHTYICVHQYICIYVFRYKNTHVYAYTHPGVNKYMKGDQ